MKLFSRLPKNFFDNTLFADFFSWNGAGLKTGLYLGIIILFLLHFKAHAQYSSMDTLGYWVKYRNGQKEKHEGILVEPTCINKMTSELYYHLLFQDLWITRVYKNHTNKPKNFWASLDKLAESKRHHCIPNYYRLINNPANYHPPNTDGEILVFYTFNIITTDNNSFLHVNFVNGFYRILYAPIEDVIDIDWQIISETDYQDIKVVKVRNNTFNIVRESKKNISAINHGLAHSPSDGDYFFKFMISPILEPGNRRFKGEFFLTLIYPNNFNSLKNVNLTLEQSGVFCYKHATYISK